ncbi:hypothetical protein TYRP_001000 [Tyrophagus putrescentiae]|nr:hypothetical protein TYRP_001000 [Tyrophagus putrescentiae]
MKNKLKTTGDDDDDGLCFGFIPCNLSARSDGMVRATQMEEEAAVAMNEVFSSSGGNISLHQHEARELR